MTKNRHAGSAHLTRRGFLRRGGIAAALAAGTFSYLRLGPKAFAGTPTTPFAFTPFSLPLPIPGRLAPVPLTPAPGSADAAVGSPNVYHGIAPEYDPSHPFNKASWVNTDPATGKPFAEKRHYMEIKRTQAKIIPGVTTTGLYGYNGLVPGATIRARAGEPMVVRVKNSLPDTECSLHLHGGHSPSHADGHPCFYIFPNQQRDYFYPHIAPKVNGKMDVGEIPSTMWFHDHGNDVTAFNVAHGLAGFCLLTDTYEETLIKNRQLPDVDLRDPKTGALSLTPAGATQQGLYDIPMAFTDQRFNADATLYWDPFDHDGRIGDIFTVNGVAQPYLNVEPRKYRFRLLGASLARVYMLRLSNGQTMTQIGHDSWMLPKPVVTSQVYLNPARRADIIVDFTKLAGQTIYLENIMQQTSGRKPDGVDPKNPTKIVKFVVGTKANTAYPEFTLPSVLREHTVIQESEATVTRYFDFNRSNGAWQINGEFYSAFRCDAAIRKGAVEKWVLRNGSGGWWHPIHVHLESHQLLRLNGVKPTNAAWQYKSDHTMLEDNATAEILMKFRTFDGPFVFHCHNNNHEDMRMMKQMEVCPIDPLTGVTCPPMLNNQWFSVPQGVCGVPTDYVKSHPGLFS